MRRPVLRVADYDETVLDEDREQAERCVSGEVPRIVFLHLSPELIHDL